MGLSLIYQSHSCLLSSRPENSPLCACVEYSLWVEAVESGPCIEMGWARVGECGDTNTSLFPAPFFHAKILPHPYWKWQGEPQLPQPSASVGLMG